MSSSYYALPFKRTKPALLKQELHRFLTQNYSEEVVNIHKEAVVELDALRTSWQELKEYKGSVATSLLSSYLLQLLDLYPKVSDSSCSLVCNFVWYHSYEKASLIIAATKNSSSNLKFEICNVAHLLMTSVWNECLQRSFMNEEDLKNSLQDFQIISGMFMHFSNYSKLHDLGTLLSDLNPNILAAYSSISIAYANEMMYHRAHLKKMSNSTFVVISRNLCDIYRIAESKLKSLKSSSGFIKDMVKFCQSRNHFFKAVMNYSQSFVELDNKKYGLYVSRAIAAGESLKDALKLWPCPLIQRMEAVITDKANEACNDNRCIYNETIIKFDDLPELEGSNVLQDKPFDPKFLKLWITHCSYSDAFEYLHSRSTAKLVVYLNRKKDDIANTIRNKIDELNKVLKELFISYNIPACLEDHEPGDLPPSLLAKMEAFRNYGGLNKLRSEIENIKDVRKMNTDMAKVLTNEIIAEAEEDLKFHQMFSRNTHLTPSSEANQSYLSNLHYIEDKLDQAKSGDELLIKKFADFADKLAMLSRPPQEIAFETVEAITFKPHEAGKIKKLKETFYFSGEIFKQRAHILELINERPDRVSKIESLLKTTSEEAAHLIGDKIANEDFEHALDLLELTISQQTEIIYIVDTLSIELNLNNRVNKDASRVYREMASYYSYFEDSIRHIEQGKEFHMKVNKMLLNQQDLVTQFISGRKSYRNSVMEKAKNVQRSANIEQQYYGSPNQSREHRFSAHTGYYSPQPSYNVQGGMPQNYQAYIPDPGYHPQPNPSYSSHQNPGYPAHQNPGYHSQPNPGYPTHQNSGYPAHSNPGYPSHPNSGYPSQPNRYPTQGPGYPVSRPGYPPYHPPY